MAYAQRTMRRARGVTSCSRKLRNEALRNPENLREVRRRFDIFYSRMRTLQRGEVFQALRSEPEFEQSRQGIENFLSTSVSQIDGGDAALVDALPAMASAAKQVAADVRQISLSGLAAFAKLSDQRREEVVQSLVRVSIVSCMGRARRRSRTSVRPRCFL